MSKSSAPDGSEDVTEFLRRIRDLGDKKEDMERSRNLEEEIAEGKRQREARRAERARSLSPEKQSPAGTPRSLRSPGNQASASNTQKTSLSLDEVAVSNANPLDQEARARRSATEDTMNSPKPDLESLEKSYQPSNSLKGLGDLNSSPRRIGTLVWQQKPTPASNFVRPEVNITSKEKGSSSDTAGSKLLPDEEPTREAIAKSLASKDPTWFRQTAERGIGSAAYRKGKQDEAMERGLPHERLRLHGLSEDSRVNPVSNTYPGLKQSVLSSDPMLQQSAATSDDSSKIAVEKLAQTSIWPERDSRISLLSEKALLGTPEQTVDLPGPTSLQKGRISPERPTRSPSPTKGLGGFVQSAMLSRTNSVTKRWSATSGNQVVRPGSIHVAPTSSDTLSTSTTTSRPSSVGFNRNMIITGETQPSNSHTSATADNLSNTDGTQRSSDSEIIDVSSKPLKRPSSPDITNTNDRSDFSTPSSPSKRWSPTKSSWLETALSKPESPKPKPSATKPSQPAWLLELNRNRQQHGKPTSAERSSHEGDFLEPDQAETKFSTIEKSDASSPKTSRFTPPTKAKPSKFSSKTVESDTSTVDGFPRHHESSGLETTAETISESNKVAPTKKPLVDTPPKPKFGAALKSRPNSIDQKQPESLEFQKAFDNLKRTKTEKYVAPDELKDNITRGKAALAVTSGPQKYVRKDEFKESLISQRGSMKAKAQEGGPLSDRNRSSTPAVTTHGPEPLTNRQALGLNESHSNIKMREGESLQIPDRKLDDVDARKNNNSAQSIIAKDPSTLVKATAVGSKLADRFNPGLAGMLAKGRPSGSGLGPTSTVGILSESEESARSSVRKETERDGTGQLQHLTKSRARGPKRRLPRSDIAAESTERKAASPDRSVASNDSNPSKPVQKSFSNQKRTPPKPTGPKPRTASSNLTKSKPEILAKSPRLIRDVEPPTNDDLRKSLGSPETPSSSWLANPARPLKPSAAVFSEPPQNTSSPLSLTPADPESENADLGDASDKNLSNATGQTSSPRISSSSPSPQASEAGELFAQFFNEAPEASETLAMDTRSVWSSEYVAEEKVKTTRKQISEITGDGKIVPVPSNLEYMLFSGNMYLCVHAFSNSKKSDVVETYLWVGSEVADSSVDDVQLFAKNSARQVGGQLVMFRQGKEPARFFEALGGICITRTGTSTDAPSTFVLCGRQHLGHITFDEVDFTLNSLCSAFPFIVSSSHCPKLFLWKGSGCNAEELGCARLISMDLGSNNEVVEIEEGQETPEFLSMFSASSNEAIPRSAEFWKRKRYVDKYRARLFVMDKYSSTQPPSSSASMVSQAAAMWHSIRRPPVPNDTESTQAQVAEIIPFCQADLEPGNIYVLDTFFEIYILIGSSAQDKARAFVAALLFAQDYGILAASTEDRPFVPVSSVVLEGAPRDMRAVFRSWDESLGRTGSLVSGRESTRRRERGESRGKGLKVVPLSAALAAIGASR